MERSPDQDSNSWAAIPDSSQSLILRARSVLDSDGEASPELLEVITLCDEALKEDPSNSLPAIRAELKSVYLSKLAAKYNQFLSSIVMALRSLPKFVRKFLSDFSYHSHQKDPCIVCELKEMIVEKPRVDTEGLQLALHKSYPSHTFFSLGHVNDASKVLEALFRSIHLSAHCEHNYCGRKCTSHEVFCSQFFEVITTDFNLELKDSEYTRFFQRIDANELLDLEVPNFSKFDEMLKRDMYALRVPEDGSSHRFLPDLSRRADCLIIILEWSKPSTDANLSHILEAIPLEMRPEPTFHDSKHYFPLTSMICSNSRESICFSYNDGVPGWFRNGVTVVHLGNWFDICDLTKKMKCEPHVLIFEAKDPYGGSFL